MSRSLFWIACPECSREFVVDSSLRHTDRELICPYCMRRFLPDESPKIDDRPAS